MEEGGRGNSGKSFAGMSAALISYAVGVTCLVVAHGVRILGTTGDGYGDEIRSDRSGEVEALLRWTSGGWFLLGCAFLWTGVRGRKPTSAAVGLFAVLALVLLAVFVAVVVT